MSLPRHWRLPTGNDFVSLPSLSAQDFSLPDLNLTSMRLRGLVEFKGAKGAPLFAPVVKIDGKAVDLGKLKQAVLGREDFWTPTFSAKVDGQWELRLRVVCPPSERGFFLDLRLRNLSAKKALKGVLGAQGSWGAMSLRIKVFTVPGQVLHSSTRRLVLQGADGVAFIADSQLSETEANAASFLDLRENLQQLGMSIRTLPFIIQFNKRDMPNVRSDAQIESLAQRGREPVFKASAVRGEGVLESFFGLLHLTWTRLDAEHGLAKKLGIEGDFLSSAAKKLGYRGRVDSLLGAAVGGPIRDVEAAPQGPTSARFRGRS